MGRFTDLYMKRADADANANANADAGIVPFINTVATNLPSVSEDDSYKFRYIPKGRFEYVERTVQRQRDTEDEDRVWISFVKENIRNGGKNTLRDHKIEEKLYIEQNDDSGMLDEKRTFHFLPGTMRKMKNPEDCNQSSQNKHEPYQHYPLLYLDSLVVGRILTMRRKMTQLLNEIVYRLHRIPTPDGDRDLQRRQRRTTEFTVRFARNYLYELNRLVTKLRKNVEEMVGAPDTGALSARGQRTARERGKGTGRVKYNGGDFTLRASYLTNLIERDVLIAYRLLIGALMAYCKHIPSGGSLAKDHSAPLGQLFKLLLDLEDICDKLGASVISNNIYDSDQRIQSESTPTVREATSSAMAELFPSSRNSRCKNDDYNTGNNNRNQKQDEHGQNEEVAKEKQEQEQHTRRVLPNTAREITLKENQLLKTRPTVGSKALAKQITIRRTAKAVVEKATVYLRNSLLEADDGNVSITSTVPKSSRNNEQVSPHRRSGKRNRNSQSSHSSHSSYAPVLFPLRPIRKDEESIQQARGLKERVDIGAISTSRDDEKNLNLNLCVNLNLTGTESSVWGKGSGDNQDQMFALIPMIADLLDTVPGEKLHEKLKITVKGETLFEAKKNPSIISNGNIPSFITETADPSTIDSTRAHRPSRNEVKVEGSKNLTFVSSSSIDKNRKIERSPCQFTCRHDTACEPRRSPSVRKEPAISQNCFIEYKEKYRKQYLIRSMYTSTTHNEPWEIVAWISDMLVEELLTEIGAELELDAVIKKMFEFEFQEF